MDVFAGESKPIVAPRIEDLEAESNTRIGGSGSVAEVISNYARAKEASPKRGQGETDRGKGGRPLKGKWTDWEEPKSKKKK